VATAVLQRRRIEGVDRLAVGRVEGHVRSAGRVATGVDREVVHALGAEGHPVGLDRELDDPQGRQGGLVEAAAGLQILHDQRDVVDHDPSDGHRIPHSCQL
jgi:hypothetical protein